MTIENLTDIENQKNQKNQKNQENHTNNNNTLLQNGYNVLISILTIIYLILYTIVWISICISPIFGALMFLGVFGNNEYMFKIGLIIFFIPCYVAIIAGICSYIDELFFHPSDFKSILIYNS